MKRGVTCNAGYATFKREQGEKRDGKDNSI